MSNKYFILYDGRAELGDTDDAVIIEAAGSTRDDLSRALRNWHEHDVFLCQYDRDADGNLSNEEKIGHIRNGHDTLLDSCFPQPEYQS